MTKAAVLFLFVMAQAIAFGEDLIVPSPATMLNESNLIATGSLMRTQTGWELIVEESLKGAQKRGDRVRLESHFSPMSFNFEGLARVVGNDHFLFVGKFDEKTRVARPSYGNCSAWPQGTMEVLLPERTLAEVVAFAKSSLGIAVTPTKPTTSNQSGLNIEASKSPQPLPTTELPRVVLASETKKAPEAKPALPTPSEAPTSPTPWSIIVVLIVAAIGLLRLLLKNRR